MSVMKFTKDHEWVRIEGDGSGTVGITDFAQQQLGELVYVELPEIDAEVEQGAEAGVIESVKAAGDLKSPVTGSVVEVNEALADEPGTINEDPLGEGWIFKVKLAESSGADDLMDQAEYDEYVEELS